VDVDILGSVVREVDGKRGGVLVQGVPLGLALLLVGLTFFGPARENPSLVRAVVGTAALLGAWNVLLLASARRAGRALTIEIVVRKQHYLQACAQASVLLYWGWYWREVYHSAHLIVAQLLFAYAFDMLLVWSRRATYTLGFGPVPVVFSINLFLWFKPEWFYFQFLLVAVGFAAKELIRWDKDGRRVHIFNPSSFPLAVFGLALILTGTSGLTWGQEIASTQFYPPHMYLVLFLIGLPGQYFFGVTTMTLAAVVTTYAFGLAYYAATGVYFFYDSYIPIAVFLGMHLLFTDPSTSPQTELGRVIFGALYGASTIALYQLLGTMGLPTFFDKLLQVPILNLSIKWIDRAARSRALRTFDPALLVSSLTRYRRHLAYMSIWAVVFAGMTAAEGVGDDHPGQWLPFWRQACTEGRPYACRYLEDTQRAHCARGSGWACNEQGLFTARRDRDLNATVESIERGCALGFQAACVNAQRLPNLGDLRSAPPTLDDYRIVLRGSKGPISESTPAALHALACRQGWPESCAL
jgi:hypothetical protein